MTLLNWAEHMWTRYCVTFLHRSAGKNVQKCRCNSVKLNDLSIPRCMHRQFCSIILNNGFCLPVCSIDASNHVFILVQFRLLSTSLTGAGFSDTSVYSVAPFNEKHALEKINNMSIFPVFMRAMQIFFLNIF